MIFFVGQIAWGVRNYVSLLRLRRANLQKSPPLKHKRSDLGHRLFGYFILMLVVINAALGFRLSLGTEYNRFFIPLALAALIALVIALGVRYMITRKKQDLEDDEDYQAKYQAAIAEAQAAAAANHAPPTYQQSIPLQNMPPQHYAHQPAPYESVTIPGRY
jgi:Zn-dependent protease with chaperone function